MVATALTNVTARSIPPQAMSKFLRDHPEALAELALGLCERLEEAESRIASAGRDEANRRLAALLCDLERYGSPQMPTLSMSAGTRLPLSLLRLTSRPGSGRARKRWGGLFGAGTSAKSCLLRAAPSSCMILRL